MSFKALLLSTTLLALTYAAPHEQRPLAVISAGQPRPVVIWHGLGDTSTGSGMVQFKQDLEEMYPGMFVMNVKIPPGGTLDDERKAGFWGNATDQVDIVAAEIMSIPELSQGFDAIGFSQGGLFMRDYVERYSSPPVHNLLTFGSPHMGIASLIPCKSDLDVTCRLAREAAKRGVYGKWAQDKLIQAAYFRDQDRLDEYLQANIYLTRLNGELEPQATANTNLNRLRHFVMVMFDQDETVVPKQSAHFGSLRPESHEVMEMEEHDFLWKDDHIGLRTLVEADRVTKVTCAGAHMELGWNDEHGCARELVREFIGQSL